MKQTLIDKIKAMEKDLVQQSDPKSGKALFLTRAIRALKLEVK